jgi:hypothetical protein
MISEDEMLQELLDLEEGLTPWELEFIENLSHREKPMNLSEKQREKLVKLWERHCQ